MPEGFDLGLFVQMLGSMAGAGAGNAGSTGAGAAEGAAAAASPSLIAGEAAPYSLQPAAAPAAKAPASGDTFLGMSPNQLANAAGQLAQVIGKGQSIGSAAGGIANQMGQAKTLEAAKNASAAKNEEFFQALTGEGVDTNKITKNKDGQWEVSGVLKQDNQTSAAPQANAPQYLPTANGGGQTSSLPFYEALQRTYGDSLRNK